MKSIRWIAIGLLFIASTAHASVAVFQNLWLQPRSVQLALISLEGLANRTPNKIYLYSLGQGPSAQNEDFIAATVYEKSNPEFQARVTYTDPQTMIQAYKASTHVNGVVIWDPSRPYTLNLATNAAGAYGWLVFTPDMIPMATALNLHVGWNLTYWFKGMSVANTCLTFEQWMFSHMYATKNHDGLGNLNYGQPSQDAERDYLIQHNQYVNWLPGPNRNDPEYSTGLVNQITSEWSQEPMNIGVIGFWQSSTNGNAVGYGEYEGVQLAGLYGKYTIVADSSTNLSFHSLQPFTFTPQRVKAFQAYNPTKTYVAIFTQDSGGPADMQNFFVPHLWQDPVRGQVPMSYGLMPLMSKLMPALPAYLYSHSTPNDYFIGALDGIGYMQPFLGYGSLGPAQTIPDYWRKSSAVLNDMNEPIFTLYSSAWTTWDPAWNTFISNNIIPNMPGLNSIVSDLGRETGMTANQAAVMLGSTPLFHTLTRWVNELWTLSDPATNAVYDDAASTWLANEIVTNSVGGHFIAAQAGFAYYSATRVRLTENKMLAVNPNFVFVTLDEFTDLFRQSLR